MRIAKSAKTYRERQAVYGGGGSGVPKQLLAVSDWLLAPYKSNTNRQARQDIQRAPRVYGGGGGSGVPKQLLAVSDWLLAQGKYESSRAPRRTENAKRFMAAAAAAT